jgi:DNA-binding HxlR family transcriptional regulator
MVQREREFVFAPTTDEESSVTEVVELTRRKWTRPIIERLLVRGDLRYNELRAEIDGIADKVLSESLKQLEEHQLVRREVVEDRPIRVEYSLTPAGAALEDVIDAVGDWTETYREETGLDERTLPEAPPGEDREAVARYGGGE